MSKLCCKTREGMSAQGLPRVYFCCHPEDFAAYFETVSDEILTKQNCAVWYNAAPEEAYDALFFHDLGQMNLFVMPVTRRLLTTRSGALDEEFRFAIENHIPVLPLLQDGAEAELFNEKCGNLQYLDKNNADETAVAYEEKLTAYLSSVLVGDELAQKIRNAFDAYIFLSYRKKDRRYAQELMRRIHKNDNYRDIAIWYDEFLTPGEDFNEAILEALQKSALFVLAVTPNLVNEVNYIMTTEYPRALAEKKPILPVKLVETSLFALVRKFRKLPRWVDAHDDRALSAALEKAIKGIALKENNHDPEHNFCIGLAYLSGIDVEIDHSRAVCLITDAAEKGLDEAIQKLISMYRKGEGVARDYGKALDWQEKLVEALENRYKDGLIEELFENKDNSQQREHWLEALLELGDACEQLGLYDRAKAHLLRGCQEAERLSDQRLAMAYYDKLFGVYDRLGDQAKAEEYKRKAIREFGKQLSAENRDPAEALHDQYVACKVAQAFEEQESFNDGVMAENCFEIAQTLYQKYGKGHALLASEYEERGLNTEDPEQAAQYFRQALGLRQEKAEKTGEPEDLRDQCKPCEYLIRLYTQKGDMEQALELSELALQTEKGVARATKATMDRCAVSLRCFELTGLREAAGDIQGAQEAGEEAVALQSRLIQQISDPSVLGTLFDRWSDLAKSVGYTLEQRTCSLETADNARMESFALLHTVLERLQDAKRAYTLCGSYSKIAVKSRDGKVKKECYRRMIRLDSTLAGNRYLKTMLDGDLPHPYEGLRYLCNRDQEADQEKQVLRQFIQVLEQLRQEEDAEGLKDALCDALDKLIALLIKEENYTEAVGYAQQMLQTARQQEQETQAHQWLATCCKGQADYENAGLHYRFVLQQRRTALNESCPDGHDCFRMVMTCLDLSEVLPDGEKQMLLQETKDCLERYAHVLEQWNAMITKSLRSMVEKAIADAETV